MADGLCRSSPSANNTRWRRDRKGLKKLFREILSVDPWFWTFLIEWVSQKLVCGDG
jgi:hypothetical protein